jgi:hypothetical protein
MLAQASTVLQVLRKREEKSPFVEGSKGEPCVAGNGEDIGRCEEGGGTGS